MAFKKGQSGNPVGKKVGTKSQRTIQWEQLGESLVTLHAERANQIMANCDDVDFMDNFHKLLEYFKPKLARTEVKQEGVQQLEVLIKRK